MHTVVIGWKGISGGIHSSKQISDLRYVNQVCVEIIMVLDIYHFSAIGRCLRQKPACLLPIQSNLIFVLRH